MYDYCIYKYVVVVLNIYLNWIAIFLKKRADEIR